MKFDLRKIINSPSAINIAYFIGKYTPDWLGYRIALFMVDRLSARKKLTIVHAVRCNQWVVHGENLDKATLDKIVIKNFRNMAISIFDFYHNLNNPVSSLRTIEPHPIALQLVQRQEFTNRGLVVVGIHMSNFDMAFQVGGLAGVKALTLTLSELNAGYQKQLEMRKKSGLNVVPASFGSIKHAVGHLRAGGMVITALDRPDQNLAYRPIFFGRPAAIPIHYIFMALKAHVPIIVAAILKQSDGKYHFLFSEPIEMKPYSDRHAETMLNAETVLRVAEDFIRHDPSQWSMSFPVWPEAMDQVPE